MIANILLGSIVGMFFLGVVFIMIPTYFEEIQNRIKNRETKKVVVILKSGDIKIHSLSDYDVKNILTNLYSKVSSGNYYIHIVYYRNNDSSLVNFVFIKDDFVKAFATKDK